MPCSRRFARNWGSLEAGLRKSSQWGRIPTFEIFLTEAADESGNEKNLEV